MPTQKKSSRIQAQRKAKGKKKVMVAGFKFAVTATIAVPVAASVVMKMDMEIRNPIQMGRGIIPSSFDDHCDSALFHDSDSSLFQEGNFRKSDHRRQSNHRKIDHRQKSNHRKSDHRKSDSRHSVLSQKLQPRSESFLQKKTGKLLTNGEKSSDGRYSQLVEGDEDDKKADEKADEEIKRATNRNQVPCTLLRFLMSKSSSNLNANRNKQQLNVNDKNSLRVYRGGAYRGVPFKEGQEDLLSENNRNSESDHYLRESLENSTQESLENSNSNRKTKEKESLKNKERAKKSKEKECPKNRERKNKEKECLRALFRCTLSGLTVIGLDRLVYTIESIAVPALESTKNDPEAQADPLGWFLDTALKAGAFFGLQAYLKYRAQIWYGKNFKKLNDGDHMNGAISIAAYYQVFALHILQDGVNIMSTVLVFSNCGSTSPSFSGRSLFRREGLNDLNVVDSNLDDIPGSTESSRNTAGAESSSNTGTNSESSVELLKGAETVKAVEWIFILLQLSVTFGRFYFIGRHTIKKKFRSEIPDSRTDGGQDSRTNGQVQISTTNSENQDSTTNGQDELQEKNSRSEDTVGQKTQTQDDSDDTKKASSENNSESKTKPPVPTNWLSEEDAGKILRRWEEWRSGLSRKTSRAQRQSDRLHHNQSGEYQSEESQEMSLLSLVDEVFLGVTRKDSTLENKNNNINTTDIDKALDAVSCQNPKDQESSVQKKRCCRWDFQFHFLALDFSWVLRLLLCRRERLDQQYYEKHYRKYFDDMALKKIKQKRKLSAEKSDNQKSNRTTEKIETSMIAFLLSVQKRIHRARDILRENTAIFNFQQTMSRQMMIPLIGDFLMVFATDFFSLFREGSEYSESKFGSELNRRDSVLTKWIPSGCVLAMVFLFVVPFLIDLFFIHKQRRGIFGLDIGLRHLDRMYGRQEGVPPPRAYLPVMGQGFIDWFILVLKLALYHNPFPEKVMTGIFWVSSFLGLGPSSSSAVSESTSDSITPSESGSSSIVSGFNSSSSSNSSLPEGSSKSQANSGTHSGGGKGSSNKSQALQAFAVRTFIKTLVFLYQSSKWSYDMRQRGENGYKKNIVTGKEMTNRDMSSQNQGKNAQSMKMKKGSSSLEQISDQDWREVKEFIMGNMEHHDAAKSFSADKEKSSSAATAALAIFEETESAHAIVDESTQFASGKSAVTESIKTDSKTDSASAARQKKDTLKPEQQEKDTPPEPELTKQNRVWLKMMKIVEMSDTTNTAEKHLLKKILIEPAIKNLNVDCDNESLNEEKDRLKTELQKILKGNLHDFPHMCDELSDFIQDFFLRLSLTPCFLNSAPCLLTLSRNYCSCLLRKGPKANAAFYTEGVIRNKKKLKDRIPGAVTVFAPESKLSVFKVSTIGSDKIPSIDIESQSRKDTSQSGKDTSQSLSGKDTSVSHQSRKDPSVSYQVSHQFGKDNSNCSTRPNSESLRLGDSNSVSQILTNHSVSQIPNLNDSLNERERREESRKLSKIRREEKLAQRRKSRSRRRSAFARTMGSLDFDVN